jgi:branched-chain amino acid transport system permease protein
MSGTAERTESAPVRGPGLASLAGRALLPIAAVAVILVVLPSVWFEDSPYTTSLAVKAMLFAAYGIGFNLIFGCTNQLFLCVGALAGIGGYTTAIVAERSSLPIAASIALAVAGATIVGGLLSWIAVRRSLGVIFTGIVTLVFSLAFANFLLGQRDLTGSETGLVIAGTSSRIADDQVGGYYLFAGVVVGFLLIFRVLQLSHVGWAFRGLRDDEMAAELAGIDVARYRVYAATVGSAMIGLAGALYAYSAGFVSPDTYAFQSVDVRVLVLVAFGGLGALLGPVIGAGVLAVVDERLTTAQGEVWGFDVIQLREFFYGVFVIAIFLFFRRGVVHAVVALARRAGGWRRRETGPPTPAPSEH